MDISKLDWSLIQAFLAVAETGSLSGAARELGASQPTLGRQIKALEAQLGVSIFNRQPRGLSLTETGAALMDPAKAMQAAMRQIALTTAGQQESLSGTVRITASVILSATHLPPIIAQIRRAHPEIEIELSPSDATRNLMFREADIAVRMYRPTQLDLVTRHLGDLAIGAFAARSYLTGKPPITLENIDKHDFIGYDENPALIEGFAAAGITVKREDFPIRTDDPHAYWALVRAGCGIGFSQSTIAAGDDGVVAIDLGMPLPVLPIWLTAHEVMRQTPRIRRVWDMLAAGLKPLVA